MFKVDFVKQALSGYSGIKKILTTYSFVSCPFHSEKTPSCRVKHDQHKPTRAGYYNCFGCGAHGHWNELAEQLGLPLWGKQNTSKVPAVSFEGTDDVLLGAEDLKKETLRIFALSGLAAQYAGIKDQWRGFPVDFLQSVGAKICMVEETRRYYVYLPVNINGKLRGYIKAFPKKVEGYPSYLNGPGAWGAKYGLFPFDYAVKLMRDKGLNYLVLVEGPRDALRLLYHGIPAIAILGTQSWTKHKIRLLEFSGASRVVIMMDGDVAGKKAARLLKTGLRKNKDTYEQVAPPLTENFGVEVFKLWDYEILESCKDGAYDPGNCPKSIIRDLRKVCDG